MLESKRALIDEMVLDQIGETAKVRGYHVRLRNQVASLVGQNRANELGFTRRAYRAGIIHGQAAKGLRGRGVGVEVRGLIKQARGAIAGRRCCRCSTVIGEIVASSVTGGTARR